MTPYEVVEDAMRESNYLNVFGLNCWFGIRASVKVHKAEDSYLITCYSEPVAEVFKEHVVLLAPHPTAVQYSYAWRRIVHRLFNSHKCDINRRLDPRLGVSVCKIGKNIPFLSWCVVDNRGDVINSDWKNREVMIDKEKIKEYSKKLRLFFKPFEVIARLDTHREEVKTVLENKKQEQLSKYSIDRLVLKIEQTEPVTFIEMLKFARNRSYWFRSSRSDVVLAKFKNIREHLRLTFVRSCTTLKYDVYVPEDKYVKYQSMVLQQTDGLREVPVHGEIEVRRPRTRASASTSSRKD